jgi:hypothetical protein
MHLHEVAARAVVIDDGLGLLVVVLKPRVDRCRRVVGPSFARGALREPLARRCVVEREQQDDREGPVDLVEQLVERLGLRQCPGKAVEDEAVAGLQELLANELDRDVVGDELAVGKQRLDSPAETRAARNRGAIEIAGRNVRDLVLGRDLLCLRPLARSLRSQDEDVQRRNPS